jgi:hypothetical protein
MIQKFNVISQDVIKNLIDYYNSIKTYKTSSMNKADPIEVLPNIQEILENVLGRKLIYTVGNFYKHSIPYFPHTDYKTYNENKLNVVIPLSYSNSKPHLIVFDQRWDLDSVTWSLSDPVKYFSYNIGVKGSPWEYPIVNRTGKDIDLDFYNNFLNFQPRECFRDLSGTAFPFEPGSIIFFDNRHIHCTSSFEGEKLGLTLRFKE